jgi:transcriptional regulator with XRE-family HTH domain
MSVDVKKELLIHIAMNHDGKQCRFADSIGVSRAFVSAVINGKKNPSKSMLDLLGLKAVKEIRYVNR